MINYQNNIRHSPLKHGWPSVCTFTCTCMLMKILSLLTNKNMKQCLFNLRALRHFLFKNPISDHWQKHHYFHSKMDKQSKHSPLKVGRPNFCQWKNTCTCRPYTKKKDRGELWKKNNEADYMYKNINLKSFIKISNPRSLTKAPLFPLKDGQTVLAQPTQRWAA